MPWVPAKQVHTTDNNTLKRKEAISFIFKTEKKSMNLRSNLYKTINNIKIIKLLVIKLFICIGYIKQNKNDKAKPYLQMPSRSKPTNIINAKREMSACFCRANKQ